jgi:hypothetical protein
MDNVDFIHDECGGVAFVYDHRPSMTEYVKPACVIGERPQLGSIIVCSACRSEIRGLHSVHPNGGFLEDAQSDGVS